MATTHDIWKLAAASIAPTPTTRPGYAWGLHPKMAAALGKFGWDEAARRETIERHEALHEDDSCPGSRMSLDPPPRYDAVYHAAVAHMDEQERDGTY